MVSSEQSPEPAWDRTTTYYSVVARFEENGNLDLWPLSSEQIKHDPTRVALQGWRSFIFELRSPIACFRNPVQVITTPRFRIYPPFDLNKKSSLASVLDEVLVPMGSDHVNNYVAIPDHATKGLRVDVTKEGWNVCYGIRIDAINSEDVSSVLQRFLKLVRQYTRQWWVASPTNFFDTGIRLRFDMDQSFRPREVSSARDIGPLESTWAGMASVQQLINIEEPLGADAWKNVGLCLQQNIEPDPCLSFFLAAIEDYKGHSDSQCILNLALMFEIGENKARMIHKMKTFSRNKDLLNNATVSLAADVKVFRDLITDRDNIAHGKAAVKARNDQALQKYLSASFRFMQKYLPLLQVS
ncbi:hypothetical protein HN018_13135 [Lichenicola cladoniae]|uniref:Apea-like HEPN domain-containing protein n=1 Tax=Lichenicola cladoniae TaxID=1484109 RepID=A0A6M8HRF0_9PROT|nr:hypothetical protein [Lichenicola cladoniae]NPD68710.1 hypothetical protein [Acetobacteraceae bacterium]QKE90855.1 hypothetical protein HN018_13135 [Lichenicola cladoniae]